MRLHPAVTDAEALAWLRRQVNALDLEQLPDDLDAALAATAESMAAISRVVLPDDLEPLFP